MLTVFLGYVALAAALDVTLAFAALLAGFGVMGGMKGTEQARFRAPIQSITEVAAYFFIPVYFALIGYRLDLSKTFDPVMLAGVHARHVGGRVPLRRASARGWPA